MGQVWRGFQQSSLLDWSWIKTRGMFYLEKSLAEICLAVFVAFWVPLLSLETLDHWKIKKIVLRWAETNGK